MAWYFASVPFWMGGAFCVFTWVIALARIGTRPSNDPRDAPEFRASIVYLLVGCLMLYIAARTVS